MTSQKPNEEKPAVVVVKKGGLGIVTAAIFLAGEMAGSGVLALPAAMVGTAWPGLILIFLFTLNAGFSGTRLGLCWVMLEERYEEFRGEVRDPYPSIADKAVGTWGRVVSSLSITLTLYGGGCVFIVLIAQFMGSLVASAGFMFSPGAPNLCIWMLIVAIGLTPLTWMGTPKDFWFIAIGALVTTVTACVLIVTESSITGSTSPEPIHLPPPTLQGCFKAFGSIMFAFAGASTFPTIQADMKNRKKFNISASIAMLILFLIYFPMAASGYFSFGGKVQDNIVLSLSDGWKRITVEVMLLLHLISAFPIITNPPAQYFEQLLGIPADFNWKRCVFRTLSVFLLLFIAETVPSFGAILDLVGASTVTLLTFIFPPYFYMKLADASQEHEEWPTRRVPLWERVYCWVLIVIGLAGGCCATYTACKNIFSSTFSQPCYLLEATHNMTIASGH
jgi:vesicular inhibitory amino acid transporter